MKKIIDLSFLWLNAIGALAVLLFGWLLQLTFLKKDNSLVTK